MFNNFAIYYNKFVGLYRGISKGIFVRMLTIFLQSQIPVIFLALGGILYHMFRRMLSYSL